MSTPRNTGSAQPSRRGRIARVVSAIGVAALVGGTTILAACTDAPSAPGTMAPAPTLSTTSTTSTTPTEPMRVGALLRDVPLANPVSKSFLVKRSGGSFDWPEVGLKFKVPSYAFTAATMTITVTALAGDVVAFDFGPDGSQFAQPLTIDVSLKGTNYFKLPSGTVLQGAYFKHASQVDDATDSALVDEFRPTMVDLKNGRVSFTATHFSGYMVSMD